MGNFMNTIKSGKLKGLEFELKIKHSYRQNFDIITTSIMVYFMQIFIHVLPTYLGLLRPKVETPLSLERPHKKEYHTSIRRAADEYFIRKPNTSLLFPKPNR